MSDLKLLPKAAELTGYSEKAMRRKIEDGVWLEGNTGAMSLVNTSSRHPLIPHKSPDKSLNISLTQTNFTS